jgi:hypothetical protein
MKQHGHRLLLKSAIESADFTEVTLPIFEGQRSGETVWFVVTESSDRADAERRGVHYSPKMANGKGTLAVQRVGMIDGRVQFLGSVDFAPERIVVPSATGFPPKEAKPGAIGEALYTPLIELPNGVVLNAPQIKNNSGVHDRLIRIDLEKRMATVAGLLDRLLGREAQTPTKPITPNEEFYVTSAEQVDTAIQQTVASVKK